MSNFYLPEDLLPLVLARLPLKSLARFKIVSKSWNNLITLLRGSDLRRTRSVKLLLEELFSESFKAIVPQLTVKPLIFPCKDPNFGDYQCNNAMGLFRLVQERFENPRLVGEAIKDNLPASDAIQSCSVSNTGFVNVVLSREWMATRIHNMLKDGIATWRWKFPVERAIVDFSSPNIVKEMHVGHLRSTIIGDTIARMLEFSGVEVLRRNHVGDRGTHGESFYYPHVPKVMQMLTDMGLVKENEGARVINVAEFGRPLIVVKSDGCYNYTSTDLTALWYRLNEEKAEWIIHVTEVGQKEHFDMIFAAAGLAGWLPTGSESYPKVSHVGFGLVLGDDGKRFRTHSTEVDILTNLLDEAKIKSRRVLEARAGWTEEELEQTAEAVGYGAVKYADLKNNRLTNYTYDFDKMLSDKGNTAMYLQYAHARICAIIRNSGRDIEGLKQVGRLNLDHQNECTLGLHLLKFTEVVEEALEGLLPSVLCEYLYNLSVEFTTFYTHCQVNGSPEVESRLLLCEATAVVMRKCFHLLGITPVYRI